MTVDPETTRAVQDFDPHYDIVVVGARCVGASTAMLLARAGAKVLLVDRHGYGTDRISTHALMRAGVLLLHRWGLLPALAQAETPEIRFTTFHYGRDETGVSIKPEFGVDYLIAPRRTVLDRVLVDAAIEAGAKVYHGVSLRDLQFRPDHRGVGVQLRTTDGHDTIVRTDFVVGADGRQSSVAQLVGAPVYMEGSSASGYVYGYYDGLGNDGYHWYFESQVAAGAIPTNGDQHCVFVSVPQSQFAETFKKDIEGGFLRVAGANSPDLATALRKTSRSERLRGFVGVPGYLKQSWGRGWALVGDAGYFKDPLTAHGITDALRDAELLSRAIQRGSEAALADYQSERDALSEPLFEVTDEITSFDWDTEDLKEKHVRLNTAMKTETAVMAALMTRRR